MESSGVSPVPVLRQLARRQLRRERGDHTLHPTALVHEAYIKLAGSGFDASDRAHLLAIAARAYVLEVGEVAFQGTSDELSQRDSIRKSYLGY